jgi:hypothetical protein
MNTPVTRIASAGNVLAPALAEVVAAGYRVEVSLDGSEWQAIGPQANLTATDPLSLLGLVRLFEARGGEWRPTDQEVESLLVLNTQGGRAKVAERVDVWEESGAVHVLCVTPEGDPVELAEHEARAFAARLAKAIEAAR